MSQIELQILTGMNFASISSDSTYTKLLKSMKTG